MACNGLGSEYTSQKCLRVDPGAMCKPAKDLDANDFSLDGDSTLEDVGDPERKVEKEFWCSYASVTYRGGTRSNTGSSSSGAGGSSHVVVVVASSDAGVMGAKPLQTSNFNLNRKEGDDCPVPDVAKQLFQEQFTTFEIISVNAPGEPKMSAQESCCYAVTTKSGL
jgi:hypothetical protein